MQPLRLVSASTRPADGSNLLHEADVARVAAPSSSRGLPITLRGVRKAFGDHQVLRGVDLHIPASQFVAIVGRSGCGKSTLLRLIAGLDAPDAGTIAFGEERDAKQAGVRMMFQEPRLLPWARVLENVEVGLGADRTSPDARSRAERALHEVELAAKRDQWPTVLSGGQRQRVALARALVSSPRVLAFDEPLGALDALTRITMQRLLARVWSDQGFTAILVTHDVAEAVAVADRVLVLEHGRIANDIQVDLPRPRGRGVPAVAALEETILRDLLRDSPDEN
jgi:sulfonate transport system ATP-binding protein